MTNTKPKNVTVEEQRAMGIRRVNYVPPQPQAETSIAHRPRVEVIPPPTQQPIALDVTQSATANIDFRTSAQDRAVGFLIASTPRTFVFSLAVTLISMLATDIGVLAGIVMLISIFSVVDLALYFWTLSISAEGVAFYEAKQKWAILRTEQRERWAHYKKIAGG